MFFQVILRQPQRPQAAARFRVDERALLPHLSGNGAPLFFVWLVHGRAQGLRGQRQAARAQGFQLRVARKGFPLARALFAFVLVALARVFVQQGADAFGSGHSPFPPYFVRSVNKSSPSPSSVRCS